MCAYVNDGWDKTPIHLAAYLMWRLNWIHPFFGGNGRTSRAVSYLILCAKLGFVLPGAQTIPDQIVAHRQPYFDALQAADAAWESGQLDLSQMESLLGDLLATQLLSIHNQATGRRSN
jgi:Fic family protein